VLPDQAPWFISAAYIALCWAMDVIYDKRPIQVCFAAGSVSGISQEEALSSSAAGC
jgi:hypothetical protein